MVVFSPSVQRIYREKIISGSLPMQAATGTTQREEWAALVLDFIDAYFQAQLAADSSVNVSVSGRSSPAQRLPGGRLAGLSHMRACRSVRICVPALLNLFMSK